MKTNYFLAHVMLFVSASCIWVYDEKPEVCYKKYLGQGWKPDYDITRVGSIISNHQAFLDPVLLAIFVMPCHVAKGEV
jgi:1-acyl-sn-glycerol-3-phosphate acyltransferase